MGTKRIINRYEWLSLGFMAILSPLVRIMPRQQVATAWDSAWIAPLLAWIPVLLLMLLVESVFRRAAINEGFAELFIKGLGKPAGKIAILLFVGWLIYYTAFCLRVGADRYVITAYPTASPVFFMVITLVLSSFPVFYSLRSLARSALVFFPIMFIILIVLFCFASPNVKKECLAPIACADWKSVLATVPPITNILSLSVYFGFLEGRVENKKGRLLWAGIWLLFTTAVMFLIVYFAIGVFSAQEVTRLNYTFFFMVRSIPQLNATVRIEPVIIALWVSSDFVFISSLLCIIYTALRRCLGYSSAETESTKITDLKHGRFLIWIILIAVLVLSFFIPSGTSRATHLSEQIVPYLNLIVTFGLLPIILIIGRIRKKI